MLTLENPTTGRLVRCHADAPLEDIEDYITEGYTVARVYPGAPPVPAYQVLDMWRDIAFYYGDEFRPA